MSSRKFGLNLVVVLAIAALFTGFWALINRPVTAPNWPEQISGFSYSPFQQGQYPQKEQYPTDDQMHRDLEIMSKLTDNIRTYSVDGTLGDIPKLAEEFGLRVTLGIWISPDLERNEREITKAIELANTSRSVVRVVVGNEALFREEITPEALIVLLDRVRAARGVRCCTDGNDARHRLARTGKFAYPHEAVNHEGTDDIDGCGHPGSVAAGEIQT